MYEEEPELRRPAGSLKKKEGYPLQIMTLLYPYFYQEGGFVHGASIPWQLEKRGVS